MHLMQKIDFILYSNMFKYCKMNSNSYLKLLVLLLVYLVSYHQSLPLRIKGKKTIINSNSWALEWFQNNKNQLVTLTDHQIKLKLFQELTKYYKIDQKIFNQIFSIVLVFQKKTRLLEQKIFQESYSIIKMRK